MALVIINVELLPVPGSTRKKIVCPDEEASANDDVVWSAVTPQMEIRQIIFKGRSPFKDPPDELEVLDGPGSGTAPNLQEKVHGSAGKGRYAYTILVKDTSTHKQRTYVKDPDLDII